MDSERRRVENTIDLTCAACGQKWSHTFTLPKEAGDFVDMLRALQCAECRAGSDRIMVKFR